jgi:hypothetical protein
MTEHLENLGFKSTIVQAVARSPEEPGEGDLIRVALKKAAG